MKSSLPATVNTSNVLGVVQLVCVVRELLCNFQGV